MPADLPAPASPEKVLVLGDDTRSFLAVVRSLGRQGIEVHAAPTDFTAPALKSRYVRKIHYLPFWSASPAEWLDAITALLRAENFALIVPCNETTLLPMQLNRATLESLTRLAIPTDHAIEVLFDKHATRELARSLGIPVAPGRLPVAAESATAVFQELGAPVVLKPRRSYALATLAGRGKVEVLDTPADLEPLLPLSDDTLYEGYVQGTGVGVSILASRGRILQAFEHHRVRENTSGSYYRVSAPLTPALENATAAIVAALDYTGVAMVEFRVTAPPGADKWILLEVNARPWGSLPLPLSLGIDFPYRWYQLLVHGIETPPVTYKPGIFGRNLLPDLRSTASDIRAEVRNPTRMLRLATSRLMEIGRGLTGREHHDSLVRDDPGPAITETKAAVGSIASRLMARIATRPATRARTAARAALTATIRDARARNPDRPITLMVVCQGNICRSPYAAAALTRDLASDPSIRIEQAGMFPRPGRSTPDYGIAAAAASIPPIDLRPHRSAHLSRAQAEAATAIIIFDDINRAAIGQRYPDLTTPVLKLGAFSDTTPIDIADPIDQDEQTYVRTYATIDAASAALAALVRRI